MIFLFDKTDQLGVNTIRTLSIEAVQKANSGHPGLPMGAAPMAYALWTNGLIVIVLYFQQATALQCCTAYYIYQDTT